MADCCEVVIHEHGKEDPDKPGHECGVFGIFAHSGGRASRLAFFALYALQHRGQESAGICTCDNGVFQIRKGMGLVSAVFKEEDMVALRGNSGIGHVRYSTQGSSTLANAQPFVVETMLGQLGVAHNGELTQTPSLKAKLLTRGVGLFTSSDTEIIAQMLALPQAGDLDQLTAAGGTLLTAPQELLRRLWTGRIKAFMGDSAGAYSLTLLTKSAVYGVRDSYGLRPLCIGMLKEDDGTTSYCFASESCALKTIGATFLREVRPGEIVCVDSDGLHSTMLETLPKPALCVFEYVYFARPDSILEEQLIHTVRQRLGQQLARESPANADLVAGVPDSSVAAAIGYAFISGLPYTEVFSKNRYIGRTFIHPDQSLRKIGVGLKFNPLSENVAGKRIVLVDDSLVRGTTLAQLVPLLRDAGAREIHVRISSPPIRHQCYMGVSIGAADDILATKVDGIDAIRQYIGADSLEYLTLEGMLAAAKPERPEAAAASGHCHACFSGEYPIAIDF